MDPVTMMAIAQGVVQGGSAIYNMFAGSSQINQARSRLQTQQGLVDANFANESNNLANQTMQEREGLDQQSGRLSANLAQNGVLGPMAGNVETAAAAEGSNNIDMAYQDRSNALGIQKTMADNELGDKMTDLNEAQNQNTVNGIMGLVGAGLLAGGALAKGGVFSGGGTGNLTTNPGGSTGMSSLMDGFDMNIPASAYVNF